VTANKERILARDLRVFRDVELTGRLTVREVADREGITRQHVYRCIEAARKRPAVKRMLARPIA